MIIYFDFTRESVEFKVFANRVRLQLPQSLLPESVRSVVGQSGSGALTVSGGNERICQVSWFLGMHAIRGFFLLESIIWR